jgi:hypothetical protein
MCSASKAWPSRLLATAVALVLAFTYVVGAYAHAAGHQERHARAGYAETLSDGITTGAPVAGLYDHGYCAHGGGQDCDEPEQSSDCCDTICHGGQAILATAPVVPHVALEAPAIEPVAALQGADSAGLDRPPKAIRPA